MDPKEVGPFLKALDAAEKAYLALLKMPLGTRRARCQEIMAALRDFIADATAREPELVQDIYEELAREGFE